MKYVFPFLFLAGILLWSGCQKDQRPQAEIDMERIEEYIANNNLTMEEHPSGIFYTVNNPGTGESPELSSEVRVEYQGYFLDNVPFDGTPPGQPTDWWALSGLIAGWQIAIPLLEVDGEGTFLIPSELAYGPFPPRGIPANAVLAFDIKLVDFR